MQSQTTNNTIIALDVGERRVGVALVDMRARLPHPLTTLERGETMMAQLQDIIREHRVGKVVVGLPRGLDGQHTAQTHAVEAFAVELSHATSLPLYSQDEAVPSRQAEEELKGRGKPYKKGDIDALSATYILEDFVRDHPEVHQ